VGTERVDVEAVWKIKDGGASGELAKLSQNAGSTASSLEKVKTGLGSLASAVGIGAGVAGIGSFVKSIVQVNQSLESTRFSMGSVLWAAHKMGLEGAAGLRDFQGALSAGAETTKALEEHAAKAIGTTEDYVESWRAVSLPILQAGGNMANVLEVSKLLVPTAKQFGIGMETAGFSIKQALMGMVDSRDMMVQMLGLDAKQMNELAKTDKAAALEKIVSAMRNNSEAMAAAGGLFESQTASIEDAWLQLKRQIGAPLFDEIKKQMIVLLGWIEKNQKHIHSVAEQFGEKIKDVFLKVVEAVKWVADHWDKVVSTVQVLVEYWLGSKLLGVMKTAVALAGQFAGKMATAGASAGGIGAGGWGGAGRNLATQGVTAVAAWGIGSAIENMEIAREMKNELRENYESISSIARTTKIKTGQAYETVLPEGAREDAERKVWESLHEKRSWTVKENEALKKSVQYQEAIADELLGMAALLGLTQKDIDYWRRTLAGPNAMPGSLTEGPFVLQGGWRGKLDLKDLAPKVDARGSRIEIKVDARHQDPDRVATSVVNAFARAALMPTRPRTSPPFGM